MDCNKPKMFVAVEVYYVSGSANIFGKDNGKGILGNRLQGRA